MNTANTLITRFFKKTALALAVSTALLGAKTVSAQDEAAVSAFFQDYSFCDAQVLAAAWGISTYEAKVEAGRKVMEGASEVVWNDHLIPAVDRYNQSGNLAPQVVEDIGVCYWDTYAAQLQLGFYDAEDVACLWNANNQEQISEYQAKIVLGWQMAYRDRNRVVQGINIDMQQTPQCRRA